MKRPCRNTSQTSRFKMRELHPIPLKTFNFNWMKHKYLFIFILTVFNINLLKAQVVSGKYLQEIKTDIALPEESGRNVIKLFPVQNGVVAVTTTGIFKFRNGKWDGKTTGNKYVTAAIDSKDKIWLATDKNIQKEGEETKISLPESAKNDTILYLFWEDEKTLQVGTTNGLLSYNGIWNENTFTKGKRVHSIVSDDNHNLWLATNDGLLRRTSKDWFNLDDMLMANGTKRVYFSLEQPAGKNEILFGGLFSIGCIAENGDNWMYSGADGLPYGPVTTIKSQNETLWLGTDKGAIKKDKNWHYYLGKRWLTDNKINDILPIDSQTIWIATPKGISQIQKVEMTLGEKAAIYEDIIQKRHNRRGLVNISHLSVPSDLSTSKTKNEDNDGLWTSTYLAAECFRYAVTKDADAKENAIRTYKALERLETVTGISGLPARSYALVSDSVEQSHSPHPKKWRHSPDRQWQWLDDTSSDEIVGHMFAIPLFYDLVADDTMKIRVKNLVERIMNHIIDNKFHLIDYDGEPTRWGVWHPDSINHSKNWAFEKGLYSLEILSFLKTATYITENPKFKKTYQMLIQKHHYAENAVQAKMFGPFENSHSDDILTYFPYYNIFRYTPTDEYLPFYKKSLERTWAVSQPDNIPAWNIITSVSLQKDCGLELALKELQQYPVDLIDWTMENSHRWDLHKDPIADRFQKAQATRTISTPESGISRWNTIPRQFDTGRSGTREETGTYFLLPYWMGRYHGLINENESNK